MPQEAVWQFLQIAFLACLGMHLIVWSELDKSAKSPVFWVLAFSGLTAIMALIWIEAEFTRQALLAQPGDGWATADQRIRISTIVYSLLGGLLAVCFAGRRNASAWLWGLLSLLAPVAGYLFAQLFVPVSSSVLLADGQWERLPDDIARWYSRSDLWAAIAGWSWLSPPILLVLMAIGLWRAFGRGVRQRRKEHMPTAWLFLLAALLLLIVVAPASSDRLQPLGLFALGIALSVFAVADLALVVFERIALQAPKVGPSDVPRVP